MDLFKRIKDLSAVYDDDGPSATVLESRPMFNDGGMLVKPSDDGSRPGYKEDIPKNRKGQVMELPSEMKKLWKITNPEKDWATGTTATERGNFKKDFPRKKKIFEQTKGLVSLDELSSILTEELGEEIGSKKITGRYGVDKKTKLAEVIDNALFKGSFGSIQGGSGTIRYYKKPSKNDIKKILKADVIGDVRINSLKSNTIKNVLYLNKKFGDVYKAGEIPDIETILKGTKMTHGSAGTATARLAQIYNGHKFRNEELNSIRINKNTASKMFQIIENTPFGNPYRNGLYQISLDMIDQKLGNKKGTFQGLKKQATKILKENKIPIYDNKKGTKAFGFNINEIAGVTGSAKSKAAEFSQFIDVMEGNLNQKTLTNFQGQLSIARQNIENNPDMLSSESKRINKLARNLEGQYDVQLPRLRDPDATKYFSPTRIKELNAQGIDIVKAAERAGYTVEMPKKAITIKEFVDQSNPKAKKIIQNIQGYSKLPQCRIDKADGGRIGFAYSDECIRDGLKEQKIEAQKGNKKAAQELVQVGKVATRAGLLKNILGPGALLSELVLEGAIIGNKVLGGKPGDIAWAESYLSYLDPRKYRGELDPLKMRREDMTTREIEDADGNIKTIDGPNANILRSGFAAQDQLSAFNEALQDRDLAKARGRIDQYNPAAADAREQGRFADQSADIISSEAFKDASNMAQEYIQAQEGQRMFPYNQFKKSIGKFESGEDRDYRRRKEQEMKNLYTQFSDTQLMDLLENSQSLKSAGITPEQYMLLLGAGTKNITPAVTRTLSGLDAVRTDIQKQEALDRIAEAGGVANLAGGGIAKEAGDRSGAMTTSMNPDSQGLSYLFNRVKKV